jgi:hypothetical protein
MENVAETEHKWEGFVKDAWIETYTKRKFNVFKPDLDSINIEDIAHALACNARFNGHLIRPLSVAEHSYYVSKYVGREHAFVALLHDASEAYLSDVPRPIKAFLPEIKLVEQGVTRSIFDKYGIKGNIPEEVKLIDRRICASEALDSGFHISEWIGTEQYQPLDHTPSYWNYKDARFYFMNRFNELKAEHDLKMRQLGMQV